MKKHRKRKKNHNKNPSTKQKYLLKLVQVVHLILSLIQLVLKIGDLIGG